jgi:hypothetical protein
MKNLLDTGFLLTLLLKTDGGTTAWEIAREMEGPGLHSGIAAFSYGFTGFHIAL